MDVLRLTDEEFKNRLRAHIENVYEKDVVARVVEEVLSEFSETQLTKYENTIEAWSQEDIYLITYGNSILSGVDKPLNVLYQFLEKYLKGVISVVHILPFFPYSSDDGFAVIDYKQVNSELGDWQDIERISNQFDLMADLVINHISSESKWFQQFLKNKKPGCDYFITVDKYDDLDKVVRPRSSNLLKSVETSNGKEDVWCTFSHDQIDLDFSNPNVFLEFVNILKTYVQNGVRIIRLDAIAFLWKKIGTNCINLPETHEIVKVLRLIAERYFPGVLFVTETNIPNLENLKYFGNSNEAHIIYNFSLPPLLLHAMWSGTSEHLVRWSMSLPPAPANCTYLNFTASHDGIGLRPIEGMLSEEMTDSLVEGMCAFGGQVTTRSINNARKRPYELNITWMDAMKGTESGEDNFQLERFLCSQTIMLGLEGIPAFYIHSLLAGENDYEKYAATNHKRAINRRQWELEKINDLLSDYTSKTCKVFHDLKRLITIRSKQDAFHPEATQFTLHLGSSLYGFWRQSINRDQSIFAIHNITDKEQSLPLASINLICTDTWVDLIAWDVVDLSSDTIVLKPYQSVWITNKS